MRYKDLKKELNFYKQVVKLQKEYIRELKMEIDTEYSKINFESSVW